MVLYGGVVGLVVLGSFVQDEQSWFFLFFDGRGVLEWMTVLRYHALLLVSVDDCVELGLKCAYLRQLSLIIALAEQQFVAVDIEEGQRLTHILLITGSVYLLELDQLFSLPDLKEILIFFFLIPLLLQDHLLLTQAMRTESGFGFGWAQHIHCNDLLTSGWLNCGLEELRLQSLWFFLLDKVQNKLKLTQLLLTIVVQVPENGKSFSIVDDSSLAALQIIEDCLNLIGHTVKIANLRKKLKPALQTQVLDVGVRLNEVA